MDAIRIVWFAIVLAGLWGWIFNVVKIVDTVNDPIAGMFILRCIGILVVPLGAILGFM